APPGARARPCRDRRGPRRGRAVDRARRCHGRHRVRRSAVEVAPRRHGPSRYGRRYAGHLDRRSRVLRSGRDPCAQGRGRRAVVGRRPPRRWHRRLLRAQAHPRSRPDLHLMVLTPEAAADLATEEADTSPRVFEPGADIEACRRDIVESELAEERRAVPYVRDVDADGVPCRIFRPVPGAATIAYVHGGGWVLGDLDSHDRFCRELALRTGWAVVAVHYRRAPEHTYPAPLDDVETALRWVCEQAYEHEIDASTVVGVGDSAGANLVAGMSVRDPEVFAYQVLVYPPLDPRCGSAAFVSEAIAWLSAAERRWRGAARRPRR